MTKIPVNIQVDFNFSKLKELEASWLEAGKEVLVIEYKGGLPTAVNAVSVADVVGFKPTVSAFISSISEELGKLSERNMLDATDSMELDSISKAISGLADMTYKQDIFLTEYTDPRYYGFNIRGANELVNSLYISRLDKDCDFIISYELPLSKDDIDSLLDNKNILQLLEKEGNYD